jgi:hypothetical protein
VNYQELTPPYFRHLVHLIRPFPDFDFLFIEPLQQELFNFSNSSQGIVFSM